MNLVGSLYAGRGYRFPRVEKGEKLVKAKAAVIQMNFSDRTEENVEKGARLIKQAADEGAEIICLPELFGSQYFCQTEEHANFELAEEPIGLERRRGTSFNYV